MAVYERATRAVEPAQQYDMFNIYIKRAAEIYGVTHTRSIYQKAIEVPALGVGGEGVDSNSKGRKGLEAAGPVGKLWVTWLKPETRQDPGAGSCLMAR